MSHDNPLTVIPYGIKRKDAGFVVYDKRTGQQVVKKDTRAEARRAKKTLLNPAGVGRRQIGTKPKNATPITIVK